jgi:uncharacterized membrane protein YkvA (DUF1232 family)
MKRPWQLVRYVRLAEQVIRDRRVDGLGRDAGDKLAAAGAILKGVRDDVGTLIDLLRAYARGEYRDVPLRSLVLIVAGILYFVAPLDLIPDFLLGFGFVDDVTVLTYVIGVVRAEIERFRARPIDGEVEVRQVSPHPVPMPVQGPVQEHT